MELQREADSEQISEEFTTRILPPKRIYFRLGRNSYELVFVPSTISANIEQHFEAK